MNPQPAAEKVKPFRLVKYFSYTSLVVIFFGTILLSAFNTHWAKRLLLDKSEDYAMLLVENLNHQIVLWFAIPTVLKEHKIQLRNPDQFERLDKVIRSTLHSFKVEMVNIYDADNTISYSFDKELVGTKNAGGTAFVNALAGKDSSKLIQIGNFWEILIGAPKETKLVTFAALRAEKPLAPLSGPVLGVIEIVQDLSADYHKNLQFQISMVFNSSLVMAVLFIVLLFVVKRGETIIQQRAEERLKLEEELNRARRLSSLGEMVAGISHEIRNPLGIISSSAGLLKKKMAALDPGNSLPQIIVEETTRLNSIITDFLNFARPKDPNLKPCRIEDVIDKNLTFLAPRIREQAYVIQKRFASDLPELTLDADMMYQAFLNILINAMQAMPEGGTVQIETGFSNGLVQVAFIDEGCGFSEEALEKIWNPFFTTKEDGTGLGLGIVKNIIESHGGTIRAENNPDIGARIIVSLPVTGVTAGRERAIG